MTIVEFLAHLRNLDVRIWCDGDRLRCNAPDGVLTPALRTELAKRKAEIIAFLRGAQDAAHATSPPIPPTSREGDLPLSFAQQRLWILDQLGLGAFSYMPAAVRIIGQLDTSALEQSFNEIVRRHETLRTTFTTNNGCPVQVIAPDLAVKLPVTDLQDIPVTEREARARQMLIEEARRPFDLAQGPLFRSGLLQLDEKDHVLFLVFHHIVSDAWSQGVFVHEFTSLYRAFVNHHPSPLPELDIQYADFAQWQRQSLQSDELKEALAYWKWQLAGPLPILELLTDRSSRTAMAPKVVRQICTLDRPVAKEIKALSRREGVTMFATMLAAFKTLLYRYTGQTDVIVGSPVADRDRAQVQRMIGLFLNTLVLRTDLSGNPTFLELLGRVRQVLSEAFAHKDLPFERLVEELQPERDLNRNPLFQVVFATQDAPTLSLELPGARLAPFPVEFELGEIPDLMGLDVQDTQEGIICTLERKTDLLNQNILDHFQTLLKGIVADPQQRLSGLPLLTETERRQVLTEWNATKIEYPRERCTHELFEAQAARTPDSIVLVFDDQHLTYRELNRRANQLAHHLQKQGIGPELCVGISAERSLEMVVGLMGILKAGGAYVPLDPTYPVDRLAFMLEDAQVPVLLTQEQLLDGLPEHGAQAICLDTGWEAIAGESVENPAHEVLDDNLAYVIYTSGSTGRPKGAMNTHGGIRNRLLWKQETYQLTELDRVLQKTPFSFDVSVWEFFWPLLTGACLVVARPEGHKDSTYLVELIVEQGITTMHFVPSMLQVFVEEPGVEACSSLKRVICSGETLPFDLQERFFARLDAELHNLYGPTEAAVDVTFWACERQSQRRIVPIGRPIANTQIHLLDDYLQPVPVGVPGELYIGGVGLGRGYWNQPDLTAEKFVPNPFSPSIVGREEGEEKTGARLYKTGDLAYYLPDGNIEFLGRIDYQVKVRGFRIELGEIETVLRQSPTVRDVVVMAREDVPGIKRLVAYVVPRQEPHPSPRDLRDFLRKQLPDHMIPSAFVLLEALPLLPSGKVDRRALPTPDASYPGQVEEFVAPEGPVEEKLAEIWATALGVEQVSAYDTFFDLGGYSLLATQAIHQINQVFGTNLSMRSFFEEPTIASLALLIEETLLESFEKELGMS
jgi:amino acid adenylation domain-containing protein